MPTNAIQLLKKLDCDIQKSTGINYQDKPVNLHKIEKEFNIKIKQPKRNTSGKLGYHKHKLFSFISPKEREKTNRKLDQDFGIEDGEFEYTSEE